LAVCDRSAEGRRERFCHSSISTLSRETIGALAFVAD